MYGERNKSNEYCKSIRILTFQFVACDFKKNKMEFFLKKKVFQAFGNNPHTYCNTGSGKIGLPSCPGTANGQL